MESSDELQYYKTRIAPPEKYVIDSDDDGPFFDLEFTLKEADGGKGVNFTTKSSPEKRKFRSLFSSDDLFSKRKLRIFTLRPQKTKFPAKKSDAFEKQSEYFVTYEIGQPPITSLFTGEDSGRVFPPEEKKSFDSKEMMRRYFGKIKPLYVRISKRYVEKLRFFSDEMKRGEEGKKAAMPARLRMACKSLGKRTPAPAPAVAPSPERCDVSLIMREDGIQSAIAHCKRSFNFLEKDTESLLRRPESDPGGGSECL